MSTMVFFPLVVRTEVILISFFLADLYFLIVFYKYVLLVYKMLDNSL